MMKLRRIIASLACLLMLAGNCLAIDLVVDGEKLELDVPPQMVEQRTLVPLRTGFEKLGATVECDQAAQTVQIHPGQRNNGDCPHRDIHTDAHTHPCNKCVHD